MAQDGRSLGRTGAADGTPLRAQGQGGGPEKIYYKIGEVARLLELPQYVLRYWETEFPALSPRKTSTGRRIYGRADIEFLRRLRKLLHEDRYTIEGARRLLALEAERPNAAGADGGTSIAAELVELRRQIESLRDLLARRPGE